MGHTKVLVIGLDGATLDVVLPAVSQGLMPNLAQLLVQGASGTLNSTIPAMSPPAWTSMITGQNPGKHGIYDFVRRQPGSYRLQTVRSDFYQFQTMFDYLSDLGKRVAAVNIPLTYPPRPINGVMISGLGAPRNGQFTYPPELRKQLLADGYLLDNGIELEPGHEREFADALIEAAQRQVACSIRLLRSGDWDLFMFVLRSIDEAQSFLWHYHDAQHPWYDAKKVEAEGNLLLDVHRRTDELIGNVLAAIDEDTTVFIVSDHGGGSLLKEVFFNSWLNQHGWLHLKRTNIGQRIVRNLFRRAGFTRENLSRRFSGARMVNLQQKVPLSIQHALIPSQGATLDEMIDWARTKAYSIGYVGQIYINLSGREPQGIVEIGEEYDHVLEEISSQLFDLKDPETGDKVVDYVFTGKKIYSGMYTKYGPDLVVIMKNMSYLAHSRRELASKNIFATSETYESGTHRQNGMFVIKGKKYLSGASKIHAEIVDVMPTILFDLGIPVQNYVDGKPIFDSVKPEIDHFSDTQEVIFKLAPGSSDVSNWENPQEEKEVMDRLRALGYIE